MHGPHCHMTMLVWIESEGGLAERKRERERERERTRHAALNRKKRQVILAAAALDVL